MVPSAKKRMAMNMAFATSLAHRGGYDSSGRGSSWFAGNNIVAAAATATPVGDENSVARRETAINQQQLVTTYESDHSSAGIMFNMQARNNTLIIRGMDINAIKRASDDGARLEIWTKEGTFRGYELDQNAWTLWMNETVRGNGLDIPTSIPREVFSPMTISAHEERAFYVAFTDGPFLRYSKGQGNNEDYFANDDMILSKNGASKRKGFKGGILYPRVFNGAIHYETISPKRESSTNIVEDIRSPTFHPTSSPTAQTKVFATQFKSSATYAGSMFDIVAKVDMEISSIAFNTWRTDDISVQLYTREDTYSGHDKDISHWKLHANVTVRGNGLDQPTYFPKNGFDPILVRRNKRMAFYIATDGPYMRVSKGKSEGAPSQSNSDLVIYEGAGKRHPIDAATFTPREWNGIIEYQVVDLPTLAPTTLRPTPNPTSRPTSNKFRLRLYWQRGYYWQESWKEMWWCMSCRGSCYNGDKIVIDHCGSSSRQRFMTMGDDTLRPISNPSLCMTITGYSEKSPLRLKPCDDNRWDQKLVGLKDSGRFELQPRGMSDRCVSQMHHPKKYETVYPEDCRKTRTHDTTYWTTY